MSITVTKTLRNEIERDSHAKTKQCIKGGILMVPRIYIKYVMQQPVFFKKDSFMELLS